MHNSISAQHVITWTSAIPFTAFSSVELAKVKCVILSEPVIPSDARDAELSTGCHQNRLLTIRGDNTKQIKINHNSWILILESKRKKLNRKLKKSSLVSFRTMLTIFTTQDRCKTLISLLMTQIYTHNFLISLFKRLSARNFARTSKRIPKLNR